MSPTEEALASLAEPTTYGKLMAQLYYDADNTDTTATTNSSKTAISVKAEHAGRTMTNTMVKR